MRSPSPFWLTLRVFFDRANTEAVLEHVQHHNENHESAQRNDRDVGKRSRDCLMNDRSTRRDLAMTAGETIAQALACVIP